ncbi:hypothetical protein DML12_24430 [Salmonella enterica]|nr:hypothetical protein [Salmonella enterica subsp. enterica serovar Enteritidis]EAV6744634.1 hypothetical protein [Salmonella enterica]EAZ5915118.1 hypothetical protein [Salmonella enterica]EBD5395093.1 hypothetical protein [Salmonella enterica]EBI9705604.1 hypothetical protein [Salmonella enterica]
MRRERFKRRPHKNLSTNARHRGGAVRSSDESPVMGLERRGCIVQPLLAGQPETGGFCWTRQSHSVFPRQLSGRHIMDHDLLMRAVRKHTSCMKRYTLPDDRIISHEQKAIRSCKRQAAKILWGC